MELQQQRAFDLAMKVQELDPASLRVVLFPDDDEKTPAGRVAVEVGDSIDGPLAPAVEQLQRLVDLAQAEGVKAVIVGSMHVILKDRGAV